MTTDETVTCTGCGAEVDSLAVFPGGICLECYKQTPEANAPLTDADIVGMWGGKIHKAEAAPIFAHDAYSVCVHCHKDIKRVPGGRGSTWVHADTGAVAGSGSARLVGESE